MSITAANLTAGIRVDRATLESMYVISVVTDKDNTHVTQTVSRVTNPELLKRCMKVRINGKGRKTPVADTEILRQIAVAALTGARKSIVEKHEILTWACRRTT